MARAYERDPESANSLGDGNKALRLARDVRFVDHAGGERGLVSPNMSADAGGLVPLQFGCGRCHWAAGVGEDAFK
ncbi:hypothetical protein [Methylobacterium sp. CM6247]